MDNKMFNELLDSVQQMDAIKQGNAKAERQFVFDDPEVKKIRLKMGMTQNKFATLIGVSKRTIENWEQGRRHPTGPARALLKIVASDPEKAIRTLHS